MTLPLYLAMTAAEISAASALPPKMAYMACHFSAYSTGLSNLPRQLPENGLLILNDRMPVQGHDPRQVAAQLTELVNTLHPSSVLLDFQRSDCQETYPIAKQILDTLPCPVCISEHFAKDLCCPVFLSPPPLCQPLEEYMLPWQGREIWLEAALDCQCITVTEAESVCTPCAPPSFPLPFSDAKLHCHYRAKLAPDKVQFTLCRTQEDLQALLTAAQSLGVAQAVGLYQELRDPLSKGN